MLRRLLLLLALAVLPAQAPAPQPLTYQVIRTGAQSFEANIVLIKGQKRAVLVDAPFTRADAHRVVAAVLESGLELEAIVVTHDHPDHYYSAEVIREAFPHARFVAHPEVVKAIWHSLPYKQARWTKVLGANGPRHPTAPEPLDGDVLMLEGQRIEVIGPMQGDHRVNTVLWLPATRTLLPSDMVHNQVVLWFVEHDGAQIAEYRRSLGRLYALNPAVVVPGHERPGLPHDRSALDFTRDYLDAWPRLVRQARDGEHLVALVKQAFPQATDPNGDFSLRTSARVAKGEEPKWDE
jgi:glyoxylase-like metal-dependent hydrolase (beta-lactamase superfamily II)